MKQVTGFANSLGTRMTAVALARLQSRRSGATATEQIRTRAVSIASSYRLGRFPARLSSRTLGPSNGTRCDFCHTKTGERDVREQVLRRAAAAIALGLSHSAAHAQSPALDILK